MQVALNKPDLERFVRQQVNEGRYSSADEVIEAAVTRLMHDQLDGDFDEQTVAAILQAQREFERGEARPFSEVAQQLRRKHLDK